MKLSWKSGIALVAGGLILGGMLSAVGQEGSQTLEIAPAQAEGGEQFTEALPAPADGEGDVMFRRGPGGPHGGPGLVRSESVVEGREDGEFRTVLHDRGELTAIDGNTLSIKEADGETVEVAVSDDTVIHRNREEASVDDLVVGDHVGVHRVDEGDGFVTKHVMAISAEQYAEMEAQREACQDNDQATECERPRHRGPGGPRGPGGRGPRGEGDVERAPEPSAA